MYETGTPLRLAIRHGDLPAVRALLRQRPEADGHEIAAAVRRRLAPALEALHEYGVDLNAPATRTGQTPLHLAAGDGWEDGVALLLRLGCEPGRRDREERTPLDEALLHGRTGTAKRLLEAEPSAARGLSLSSAVVHGDPELVRALLDAGADPERTGQARVPGPYGNRVTEKGRPLELAGSADVVDVLVAHGASAARADMTSAVMRGEPDVVRALLAHGAADGTGPGRAMLLQDAATAEVARLLLEPGRRDGEDDRSPDPDAGQGTDQGTALVAALERAVDEGRIEVARVLLEHGTDPWAHEGLGKALLEKAHWYAGTARALLAAGVPGAHSGDLRGVLDKLVREVLRGGEEFVPDVAAVLAAGADPRPVVGLVAQRGGERLRDVFAEVAGRDAVTLSPESAGRLPHSDVFVPSGRRAYGITAGGAVVRWSLEETESGTVPRPVSAVPLGTPVRALAAAPVGGLFALATPADDEDDGDDGDRVVVRSWAAPGAGGTRCRLEPDRMVGELSFSPDGRLLAVAREEDCVRLFDTATGEETGSTRGVRGAEWDGGDWSSLVAFSPSGAGGQRLATAGTMQGGWWVNCYRFEGEPATDGKSAAAGAHSSVSLSLMHSHRAGELGLRLAALETVRRIAWSPDGADLALYVVLDHPAPCPPEETNGPAECRGYVALLDPETGRPRWRRCLEQPADVGFSGDGRRLALRNGAAVRYLRVRDGAPDGGLLLPEDARGRLVPYGGGLLAATRTGLRYIGPECGSVSPS